MLAQLADQVVTTFNASGHLPTEPEPIVAARIAAPKVTIEEMAESMRVLVAHPSFTDQRLDRLQSVRTWSIHFGVLAKVEFDGSGNVPLAGLDPLVAMLEQLHSLTFPDVELNGVVAEFTNTEVMGDLYDLEKIRAGEFFGVGMAYFRGEVIKP